MKTIMVNPEKCAGCRLCELVCSLKNAGEFNPAKARIHVIGFDEVFALPVMCLQCETPHCAIVCPTNAITRDAATGVVQVAGERCAGCKTCMLACPFGNIAVSAEEGVAVKCDTCQGDPECVAICPTGALQFKEAHAASLDKKQAFSDRLKRTYEGMK